MNKGQILLPLLTSVLFAGSFITGKYTTADLLPITSSLLRYLCALLFLLGLVAVKKRATLKVQTSDLYYLVLAGLFGIVSYHYFFFSALRYTEALNTAIINALSPVLTAILALVIIKEKLSAGNYAGLMLAILGVLVLFSRGDIDNLLAVQVNFGDALMLLSVLSWAIYALLIKKLTTRYAGLTITCYVTFFGVLLLIPLAIAEGWLEQIMQMSQRSVYSILYMGVAASGIGYLCYNLSIAAIGPTRTSAMVYSLVPLCVAILTLLLLDATITLSMLCSAGLILCGLNLVLRKS